MTKNREESKIISFRVPLSMESKFKSVVNELISKTGFEESYFKEIGNNKSSDKYKPIINSMYKLPGEAQVDEIEIEDFLTPTEIKHRLEEKTGQKLSTWKIGRELKALGFHQEIKKILGKTHRVYIVIPKNFTRR